MKEVKYTILSYVNFCDSILLRSPLLNYGSGSATATSYVSYGSGSATLHLRIYGGGGGG
jgi:hypothetical protein